MKIFTAIFSSSTNKDLIEANKEFICNDVLAKEIAFGKFDPNKALDAELEEGATFILLVKS